MNHYVFSQKKKGNFRSVLLSGLFFILLILCFLFGLSSVSESSEKNYTESLRQSVLRSAVLCYAIEGRYPESLSYLKEHYGIQWNEDQYVIDYEIIGANLRPDVTIIPLD